MVDLFLVWCDVMDNYQNFKYFWVTIGNTVVFKNVVILNISCLELNLFPSGSQIVIH